MRLFLLLNIKDILKNVGNQKVSDPIDFHILWKLMGTTNCLVTHIFKNNFYVQQKKALLIFT